jgi:hypothetical protein
MATTMYMPELDDVGLGSMVETHVSGDKVNATDV